ncbi:MAG TPA: UDP-N-acetylmuramoyl-L-alanine--D-glutamate ligase [Thiotrichales bacterium]|nr:UDP-N-acetylmuramoyl-L-alanine--D-glutamate ligase [Thiotrichales bacterium]
MTAQNRQSIYTLVVGLGKTGLSVVRYLNALGERVVVADSRDIPPGLAVLKRQYPDVPVHTGDFDEAVFVQAHRIIVSPGVPLATPALQQAKNKGVEICGDIDLFAHEVSAPVLGITGSNGKSTVTTLVAKMAAAAGLDAVAGGNIGVPALDLLDEEPGEKDLYALELSSFQLETLNHLPMKAAVVLNISADHLDRYENLAAYAYSKQVIYENAETWVVNADDVLAAPSAAAAHPCIAFTLDEPQAGQLGIREIDGVPTVCLGEKALIEVPAIRLKGAHNLQNALAALALGMAVELPIPAMLATLKTFTGLPHRTQWVAELNGVNWINDSKATNVGAAIAAIQGLPGKQVLIAGGEAKDADFSALAEVVKKHCRAVILIGKDAAVIEQAIQRAVQQAGKLSSSAVELPIKRVLDMTAAVHAAAEVAQPNDNILLAPACASFDMFDSFEHRGEVYMQAVRQYCEAQS